MVADFRQRFWVSLVLSVPVLALAPLNQAWLGLAERLAFPGDRAIQAMLAPIIYFYEGRPFLRGTAGELGKRQPGMMTLIALAITVAWGYSGPVTLGLQVDTTPARRPRRHPSGNCFVIFVRRVSVLLAHA